MIAYIRGELSHLEPSLAIVDCGGVGYGLRISLNTYQEIQGKKEVQLWTYFQVREDAQVLFAFSDKTEKKLFELLISVSGVGGNTALMILSSLSPGELLEAIRLEHTHVLKHIKGIGVKTAGRIVLELKDKVDTISDGSVAGVANIPMGGAEQKKNDALQALQQLGMPKATMIKRVEQIIQEQGNGVSVEEIIKLALRNG